MLEIVTLDWSCAPLADGLACYCASQFFEAHEHWEAVWLTLQGPEKSFLQSLIQIAGAFHHLAKGNRKGAASLLRRALKRLELCPAVSGGIEAASLREEVRKWLPAIESDHVEYPTTYPAIRPTDSQLK